MPNYRYQKGRRKEYKVIKKLKDIGCRVVFRSAGSHSEVDVIGINEQTKTIFLIQCKPDSMSENDKSKIYTRNIKLNDDYMVTFQIL